MELEILTNIDVLLRAEKGVGGRKCHSVNRFVIAKNKYMKDYCKIEESSYLKYWSVNNLYGSVMLQMLPINGFCKWVEDVSEFDEKFIKIYNK